MINQQQMTNQEALDLVSSTLSTILDYTQGRKYAHFRQKCVELQEQLADALFSRIEDEAIEQSGNPQQQQKSEWVVVEKKQKSSSSRTQDGNEQQVGQEDEDGDSGSAKKVEVTSETTQSQQAIHTQEVEDEDEEEDEANKMDSSQEEQHADDILVTTDGLESNEYYVERATSREIEPEEVQTEIPELQGFSSFGWKRLLSVFEAAVELRKPLVTTSVIDSLCRMIAKGFLVGVVPQLQADRDGRLTANEILTLSEREAAANKSFSLEPMATIPAYSPATNVVQLMCSTYSQGDEGVELSILRGLLTAVVSPNLMIHGQALIVVIKTCFNTFIQSRNEVVQISAKAVMIQILRLVIARMESRRPWTVAKPINLREVFEQSTLNSQATSTTLSKKYSIQYAQNMLDEASEQVVVVRGLGKMRIITIPSSQEQPEVDDSTINSIQRKSASSPNIQEHKNLELSPQSQSNGGGAKGEDDRWMRDMYLVFRALCRISYHQDQAELRGRILALELLKFVLEESGETVKTQASLTNLIKNHLNYSLLKNSMSSELRITQLTCSILYTLLKKLRAELKAENGVFYPMILLKAIESTPSQITSQESLVQNFEFKKAVIQCLQEICGDGQLLVDLFVNYDCDLESTVNIFERMVTGLVAVAHGNRDMESRSASGSQHYHTQDWLLRQAALQCLVSMVKAMYRFWQETTSSLAKQHSINDYHFAESETDNDSESLQSSVQSPLSAQNKDYDVQLLTKRKFLRGVGLFNQKPNRGVTYLQEEGLVGLKPKDVAKFIIQTDGLDKTKIGEYLGEKDDFNIQVMHAYVDSKDFSGLEIDDAIREFLVGFRLPGEGQKIDRLMEKFAERYFGTNSQNDNSGVFKHADAAYVLSYSIIMLNTDLHNPTNKNKMTKEEFIRNNRGINAGDDLPPEFLIEIYERILNNEIKMRDEAHLMNNQNNVPTASGSTNGPTSLHRTSTVFETLVSLLPNRKTSNLAQPSEDAIKNTLDYLKQKAKGAQFFISREPETLRPMWELSWTGILGVFTKLFEEAEADHVGLMCLDGLRAGACLSAVMGFELVRNAYIKSLANFTSLTTPQQIMFINASAFKSLLSVAEEVGDHLHESWTMILRCMSRFEHLHQLSTGAPSDSLLFSSVATLQTIASEPIGKNKSKGKRSRTGSGDFPPRLSMPMDSFSEFSGRTQSEINNRTSFGISRRRTSMRDSEGVPGLPAKGVLEVVSQYEFNRLFIASDKLDSDAIVEFVRSICEVSFEELRESRVFSLAKIVEIAHFNMDRIRIVWNRVWAVLSDFFIEVGCSDNLQIAMYAVDSLRQLSMKFLERDELSNYSFQNDFLRPFTVIMRHSQSVEIRELIIRCISQMILARVQNIKSGWKTMFMVFSQAATDKNQAIVYLAFETVERIVRDHFRYITETETIVFTDCVNCLTAFANNPHNSNVALNAIAFLRYCALKLAEGTIGNVEDPLPEGTLSHSLNVKVTRIISQDESLLQKCTESVQNPILKVEGEQRTSSEQFKFTDRDEHVYYWFPLLTGLSELTFDPREEIRYGALEVLFDTLKFHGSAFSESFWARVLDSVLLPIFDHVRAEVTDTMTFSSISRRAVEDAWLYETCTQCLYHLVDVHVQYYSSMRGLLFKLLRLLKGFTCRSHESLALMGVHAFGRLLEGVGSLMDQEEWERAIFTVYETAMATLPGVRELVTSPVRRLDSETNAEVSGENRNVVESGSKQPLLIAAYNLREGVGARRLKETRCRMQVQLELLQICIDLFMSFQTKLSIIATTEFLNLFDNVSIHARGVNMDMAVRRELQWLQHHNQIRNENCLPDPPLLRIELRASDCYLSVLQNLQVTLDRPKIITECQEDEFSSSNQQGESEGGDSQIVTLASQAYEFESFSDIFVNTLIALNALDEEVFKQNLRQFFPLLTSLLRHPYTPKAVLKTLGDLYDNRIAKILNLTLG